MGELGLCGGRRSKAGNVGLSHTEEDLSIGVNKLYDWNSTLPWSSGLALGWKGKAVERLHNGVVKGKDSEARLPECEPQLCHTPAR